MRFLLMYFLFLASTHAFSFEDVDIDMYGETNYSKQKSQSLITSLNLEYKIKLYEPDHKFYMFYVGGTVNPDYDHFGRTVRLNGFTNLGVEF
jgi:hypothetical protein